MHPSPLRCLPLACVVLLACGDDEPTAPPEAALFEVVSGNRQSGRVGAALPERIVVYVRDRRGEPAAGIGLEWTAEQGEFRGTTGRTGPDGRGSAVWELGTRAGQQRARVRVAGAAELIVYATAEPGPPTRIVLAAHVDTLGAGRTLQLALDSLHDAHGNRITERYSPTWRSLDPERLAVDDDGVVRGLAAGPARVVVASGAVADTARLRVLPFFPFAQVDGGYNAMCALSAEAVAYCWSRGVPERVPGGLHFAQVTVGERTRCGLTADGALYCWAQNTHGQIGPGLPGGWYDLPTATAPAHRFRFIAQGAHGVTCGIEPDDTLLCWGHNDYGQLGRQTPATNDAEPAPPAVDAGFETVAMGPFHGCGIVTTGETYCWGQPIVLGGGGDSLGVSPPVRVDTDHRFVDLASGHSHACGVTAAGETLCWGANRKGQLGVGDTLARRPPTRIAGEVRFTKIEAGGDHTCGLTSAGIVYCWGQNGGGQVGDGAAGGVRLRPTPVAGGLRFVDLAATFTASCGVAEDATLYCWGEHVGRGDIDSSAMPAPIGRPAEHLARGSAR